MATALWLRTIRHQRMDRQHVEPCTRDDPQTALGVQQAEEAAAIPCWRVVS